MTEQPWNEPIPYPDYGSYADEGGSWLRRVVWMVAGFNLGFVALMGIAFVLLPAILPDFAPRRHADVSAAPATSETSVAVVIIEPTLTPTPLPPTATPLPPTETPIPTQVAQLAAEEVSDVVLPSPTQPPSATPIPSTPTPLPAPVNHELTGFTFQRQTWNNCGPANLAMGLSYYGWEGDQRETATFLKPNSEDKNVSPDQMVAYVNQRTNLMAAYRVGGTLDQLRWLVANEFVVIIESGYHPPGDDWYGHYRTVVGYDNDRNEFYFYDSFLGRASRPRVTENARTFDADWQAFNRTYIVVYPPQREAQLRDFLGRDWNPAANYRGAADVARQEAASQPDNAFAWFNLGSSLTAVGEYENAARAFDQAFNLGLPWRMLWYQFGPFEAYFQSSRLDDVVALAQNTISTTPYVEETYYFLGRVNEVRGNIDEAISQYETALRFNRNFQPADDSLTRLQGA
jgi:tetratricopeptide (TPR) repeat protein